MISLFLVLRLINMPCFALVSYFGLVLISIGFSSLENFEFRFQHFLFCFFLHFRCSFE